MHPLLTIHVINLLLGGLHIDLRIVKPAFRKNQVIQTFPETNSYFT